MKGHTMFMDRKTIFNNASFTQIDLKILCVSNQISAGLCVCQCVCKQITLF